MFKLNRTLPALGAATLLATLVSSPASAAGAAGAGGGGDAAFSAGKARHAGSAACKEMTVNGGFELPKLGAKQDWYQFDEDDVQAWRTDDPAGKIEIWGGGNGVPARFGKQFAELNATGSGNSVYQDIKTKPNTKIYWSFWIRARDTSGGKDVDATQIHFGRTPRNSGSVNGVGSTFAYSNSAGDVQWKRLYGWYKTGAGQTMTRVTLTAVESASTDEGYGNLVDGLTIVENKNCI
ncbi:hypothetical protein KZZ52_40675 [Dactylosporangium sp. AC04546]|uniref:hypothetical protein n=1 Tax=Dactylosporangium sp. AC04546 TaxID=2862460 RepID=UPI001EE0B57D|nr:hypothetical protein [Dactylosporangium sp. AC04546]WVK80261.1 hypothetical protein KZZ52_40675 [Dactylosporangium sp. AC04546]